jgi:hypothetical protein
VLDHHDWGGAGTSNECRCALPLTDYFDRAAFAVPAAPVATATDGGASPPSRPALLHPLPALPELDAAIVGAAAAEYSDHGSAAAASAGASAGDVAIEASTHGVVVLQHPAALYAIPPGAPPLAARSCFGGLALYDLHRLRAAHGCRYSGVDVGEAGGSSGAPGSGSAGAGQAAGDPPSRAATGAPQGAMAAARAAGALEHYPQAASQWPAQECEHVPFHQCLARASSARLVISPSMLNSDGMPH